MCPVVRIELRLPAAADWIRVFDSRDGTLQLDREPAPPLGAAVRLDLVIGETGPRVILRGTVIASRDGACTVAVGPNERVKINYLNGYVRGGLLDLRERRRLPLRLPVTYGGLDGPAETFTRDISAEGVFVVTESPLPEESEVHLLIGFPGREQALSLTGTVSHTVVVEDEDVPGMGIVFGVDEETAAELRRTVEELERRFLGDDLPEALLE
jgi:uncharacterized protein (TIGR02266 family)